MWRTRQRTDAVTGKRYPWLCQEQAMVNHWYFYGFDADFGPFYVKFCGYFPYTGQIYLFSELCKITEADGAATFICAQLPG